MIFDYQLDCENDFLLASGKNARKNECKSGGNSFCHYFTLKEDEDETNKPKVLPGKVSDSFLYDPACDIKTRSVIYPCNRSKCHLPCICKQCRKRMTQTCSKSDSVSCVQIKQQFQIESQTHLFFATSKVSGNCVNL